MLCAVLCLPLLLLTIVGLYLSAWTTCYLHAQTDFPISPSWVTNFPLIVSYLYWRYYEMRTLRFKEIVSEDIPYHSRSKLDVYYPPRRSERSPILIFIYGGAWSSGFKLLYATLANTLRQLGYVVIVPDYRKYPIVKIDEMYEDVREAIKWAYVHSKEINGDPDMIYIMGHSAGAQMAAQVVLSDVIGKVKYHERQSKDTMSHVSMKHGLSMNRNDVLNEQKDKAYDFLPQVEGLLLFSGVYDIQPHIQHETMRGVEKLSALSRVMGLTEQGYITNSPIHLIEANAALFRESEYLLDIWPRILLLHGQADTTVPIDQSINFSKMLEKVFSDERLKEIDLRQRFYKNIEHGEPVTDLMENKFKTHPFRKSLLRDIQFFINMPPVEDKP
ncbi:Alpha/Beta hydrolase protein [Pilobolus umbonatus]|nr:Alpha/Beta hydrolase protein [Pilobolus umbonatus]